MYICICICICAGVIFDKLLFTQFNIILPRMLMYFTYILIFISSSIIYRYSNNQQSINNNNQQSINNNNINNNNINNNNEHISTTYINYFKNIVLPAGFLGIITYEANVLTYTSMTYTSVVSVTLLNLTSIPMVFFLSYWILRYRFCIKHYIGIILCTIGFIFMLFSDSSAKPTNDSTDSIYGDILCLGAAALYTFCDIGEEIILKTMGMAELLMWMSLFALVSSTIQTLIWFREDLEILNICFLSNKSIIYFIIACISQWIFSIVTPYVISRGGASFFNLSLLSTQAYSTIASYFIFSHILHWTYIINLVLIIGGLIIYLITPVNNTSVLLDDRVMCYDHNSDTSDMVLLTDKDHTSDTSMCYDHTLDTIRDHTSDMVTPVNKSSPLNIIPELEICDENDTLVDLKI
eukprot:GHVL01038929.1.p1 GENE.GHVL01038929.1~~GHVL01038929.1.p1  ORF type:complete len:424 (-),score=72.16 GHVL01038929.1:167-1390(-)